MQDVTTKSSSPVAANGTVIPLVFCFDKKFSPYAGAAIVSALANSDAFYKIYCIYSSPRSEFPQEILDLERRYRCEIVPLEVSTDSYGSWYLDTASHFSAAAYYRLLIPELVAEDRAIYVDCDLLITTGLYELYTWDLGDAWIGGCRDNNAAEMTRVPRTPGDPYINSGVLLMDLQAIRRELPPEQISKIYKQIEPLIVFPDQCLINKMAEGRKSLLPERWNVQFHGRNPDQLPSLIEEYEGNAILHFSGPTKPWMAWASQRAASLWTQYARLAGIDLATAIRPPADLREQMMLATRLESENRWQEASNLWRGVTFAVIEQLKLLHERSE